MHIRFYLFIFLLFLNCISIFCQDNTEQEHIYPESDIKNESLIIPPMFPWNHYSFDSENYIGTFELWDIVKTIPDNQALIGPGKALTITAMTSGGIFITAGLVYSSCYAFQVDEPIITISQLTGLTSLLVFIISSYFLDPLSENAVYNYNLYHLKQL